MQFNQPLVTAEPKGAYGTTNEEFLVRSPSVTSTTMVMDSEYVSKAIRRGGLHGIWGSLKRSARAVQLFGRQAVLETHTLRY